MNIHEHQAKGLLAGFGVAVPRGTAAFSVDEAVSAATKPVSYTHLTLPTILLV